MIKGGGSTLSSQFRYTHFKVQFGLEKNEGRVISMLLHASFLGHVVSSPVVLKVLKKEL